ncbi:MAG: hypothetical protein MUE60_02830 [Candidatus Eisenbacteria bacterium]|jgi:hypothetical protein|nr:hypothetical protein [Candidatus Eisenbacteria bacterium]
MNRQDLVRKLSTVTSTLLHEKGYLSYPDVFMGLGYLEQKDYESWRFRGVPYLEKMIHVNLSRISFIMKTIRKNSINGKLKPSHSGYMSWGKGPKVHLRFSRSRTPAIEELWSTHFVRPKAASPTGIAPSETSEAPEQRLPAAPPEAEPQNPEPSPLEQLHSRREPR